MKTTYHTAHCNQICDKCGITIKEDKQYAIIGGKLVCVDCSENK